MAVDGLKKLIRDLENAEQVIPSQFEACVVKIGTRLLRSVKLKTPVDSGQLRRSWRFIQTGQFEGIIENSTEYVKHVEYGFRHRGGKVIDGRYMLKSSIERVESIIGDELGFIIDNLL